MSRRGFRGLRAPYDTLAWWLTALAATSVVFATGWYNGYDHGVRDERGREWKACERTLDTIAAGRYHRTGTCQVKR